MLVPVTWECSFLSMKWTCLCSPGYRECNRHRGGFAPIKGWEGGWVFLGTSSYLHRLLHDVQFPRTRNGLRPASYLERAVHDIHVPFHGTQRKQQAVRDLSIGAARDDEPQHLQFAFA